MNVEILYEFVERLLDAEDGNSVQSRLEGAAAALSNLANSPQDQNHQKALSDAQLRIKESFDSLDRFFDASDRDKLDEIGASYFFSPDLLAELKEKIQQNPMSPSVVHQYLQEILQERSRLLENLKSLKRNLSDLHFSVPDLDAEQVQLGFRLPRAMFGNNFDGFIKELGTLKFVVNSFSIIIVGETTEIELGQISTSNPLVFLGVKGQIAFAVAASVTWGLDTWQRIEEIRIFRKDAAAVEALEPLTENIDQIIAVQVENSIEKRLDELEKTHTIDVEQRASLRKAHRIILERLEQGMNLEIRMLEPELPDVETDDDDEEVSISEYPEELKTSMGISSIRKELKFPKATGKPLLKLSYPTTKEAAKYK